MNRFLRSNSGFTLIEIMIVVIVLGALASLAIPVYTSSAEKARKQEALAFLVATRESQQRYFTGSGQYAEAFEQLDFDPMATMAGQKPIFMYEMERTAPEEWAVTASRTGNADLAGGNYTIIINQLGELSSNF